MVSFLHGSGEVKPQIASDVMCEMSSHVAGPFLPLVNVFCHTSFNSRLICPHTRTVIFTGLELWFLAS